MILRNEVTAYESPSLIPKQSCLDCHTCFNEMSDHNQIINEEDHEFERFRNYWLDNAAQMQPEEEKKSIMMAPLPCLYTCRIIPPGFS